MGLPVPVRPPTLAVPLTVNALPVGMSVTCHVPLTVFVNCKPVIVVVALTTLFIVTISATVTSAPKTAVSAAAGGPAGVQFAPVPQFRSGLADPFHRKVAPVAMWAV